MENKMLKVIAVMEDGAQKEFEGKGIVVYAVTDTPKHIEIKGGVIGKFNDNCVNELIECLEEAFKERWRRVYAERAIRALLGIEDEYVKTAIDEPARDGAAE